MLGRDNLRVGEIMKEDVYTVLEDDTIVTATGTMAEHHISSIVVVDGHERLRGVLTESDIIDKVTKAKRDPENTLVGEVMIKDVFTVPPSTLVAHADGIFRGNDFEIIPVMENEELVGVITKTDVCGLLGSLSYFQRVRDIMTRKVVTVDDQKTVAEVADLMVREDVSSVIIMQDNEISGIFTEKDLLTRVVSKSRDPAGINITEVMTHPVMTINPQTSINDAAKIQKNNTLRVLPVVEDNKIVGIVSQTDILKASDHVRSEYNCMSNIAGAAMRSAASALSTVMEKDVSINVSSITCISMEMIRDIGKQITAQLMGLHVDINGDLTGRIVLILPEQASYLLTKPRDANSDEAMIDEMDRNDLRQFCELVVGTYVKELVNNLGYTAGYSVPRVTFRNLNYIINEVSETMDIPDYTVATEISCKIASNECEGLILFLYSPESFEKMADKFSR